MALIVGALMVGGGLAAYGAAGPGLTAAAAPPPVVFGDEFDGPAGAAVDAARWTNQVGGGWNNGRDLQYYTPGAHNAALTGRGTMLISARQERYSGSDGGVFHDSAYTSARLISKASVHGGTVSARIRVDMASGAFPAFWLLGTSYPQLGWPACGELDVMEAFKGTTEIAGGMHSPQSTVGQPTSHWTGNVFRTPSASWMSEWHVYTVDWTSTSLTWSIDGLPYAHVSRADLPAGRTWAVDQPAQITLNVAVNPVAGATGPDFGAAMEIDWIRVTR